MKYVVPDVFHLYICMFKVFSDWGQHALSRQLFSEEFEFMLSNMDLAIRYAILRDIQNFNLLMLLHGIFIIG